MMSHFSLADFKILSFFLSFDSLVIMCITGSLFKFILLVLDVYIHVIHQTWEVSSHISSAPFSLISFWDSQNKYACPLGSVHFSLIFFLSAPQTHNFHCLIFNITNAFFCLLKLAFASLVYIDRTFSFYPPYCELSFNTFHLLVSLCYMLGDFLRSN